MTADLVGDLIAGLPAGVVRDDAGVLDGYARDQTDLAPAGTPLLLATPTTIGQVQQILRWAHAHRAPVVPRGGGTAITGAACAIDGCVVLSTERLTTIHSVDPATRLAVVDAGVVNATLNQAAAARGLMFAPDPSSWQSATIGGNIATNAGGLRCLRYGVTRTAVAGLQVVLADGQLLRTGGVTVKRSAGYDLTQLLIGSEGTLGVIVTATVRSSHVTAPRRPIIRY